MARGSLYGVHRVRRVYRLLDQLSQFDEFRQKSWTVSVFFLITEEFYFFYVPGSVDVVKVTADAPSAAVVVSALGKWSITRN